MLQRTTNTFFLDIDEDMIFNNNIHQSITTNSSSLSSNQTSSSSSSSNPIGLGILIDNPSSSYSSSKSKSDNVIMKPIFVIIGSSSSTTHKSKISSYPVQDSMFLKACSLCKKKLTPQMDVFMYRGDQGFCSDDCRCRKILIDEIKEMEVSKNDLLASSTHWRSKNVKQVAVSTGGRSGIPASA